MVCACACIAWFCFISIHACMHKSKNSSVYPSLHSTPPLVHIVCGSWCAQETHGEIPWSSWTCWSISETWTVAMWPHLGWIKIWIHIWKLDLIGQVKTWSHIYYIYYIWRTKKDTLHILHIYSRIQCAYDLSRLYCCVFHVRHVHLMNMKSWTWCLDMFRFPISHGVKIN